MTPYERIIRREVEGQIRSFLNDHPAIAEAVDWRFSHKNKVDALVSSMAKRISRNLTSQLHRDRIRRALQEEAEPATVPPDQ